MAACGIGGVYGLGPGDRAYDVGGKLWEYCRVIDARVGLCFSGEWSSAWSSRSC